MGKRLYSVEFDSETLVLHVTFGDLLWKPETIARFRADCLAAIRSFGPGVRGHTVLVDLRQAVLQTRTVIERIQALTAQASAARIAFVSPSGSALTRLQVRRLEVGAGVRIFTDIRAAEAWLLGMRGAAFALCVGEPVGKRAGRQIDVATVAGRHCQTGLPPRPVRLTRVYRASFKAGSSFAWKVA